MKTHSNDFKTAISSFGRQIDSKITYTLNNQEIELDTETLNSISCHYEGGILKSVMKQLDIDSNQDIPLNTEINCQFGVLVNDTYEYVDIGNYIVYSSERQEDTYSYKIVCYDKMLYSMIPYDDMSITYPITIKNYLNTICTRLGLSFANANGTFANHDRQIRSELYLDENGNDLGYTFRDVLDEIAGATGSTICINSNDELEIRYINTIGQETTVTGQSIYITDAIKQRIGESCYGGQDGTLLKQLNDLSNAYLYEGVNNITQTNDDLPFDIELSYIKQSNVETINEEYFKDINVNFGEKYGVVNSIVLSRSAESDNIYLRDEESVTQNGLCEIKIVDNQIMNGNDRSDYLPDLLNVLNGLEYYINDFTSTGITYYDLCDRYNVTIGDNTYSCVMFNDEINITQGLEELIHTDMPDESETDYTKSDKTDRRINQAYIIVDKQKQEINAVVQTLNTNVNNLTTLVDTQGNQIDALGTRINQNVDSITASVTAIQNELDNGVGLVRTTSVTINDDGLNVSTDTSKISTSMTNNEFKITDSGDTKLAYFGYDEDEGISKAEMDNLTVTNYFIAGVHRVETINIDGEDRTGYFYIGG